MSIEKRRKVVLDAGPMIRHLQDIEPAATKVRQLLADARAGRVDAIMSDVNVAEVGRKTREVLSATGTDLLLALRGAGVTIRPGSDDVIRAVVAADLPLADAFAFATAKVTGARLWTTDSADLGHLRVLKQIPVTFLAGGKGPRPRAKRTRSGRG